jgi:hypothetical protein
MSTATLFPMKFVIEEYTAETFLPYVGRVFKFESEDAARSPVHLELLEVKRQGSSGRPAGFREPFALLFGLLGADALGTGSHRITHEDFEPAHWFLTRVLAPGRDPSAPYYEAVFG